MGQGWYGAIGKLAIAALLIGAVLIWRAEAWLHVDVPLEHADVIVVLGGESGQRVIGAAELYHQALPRKSCDGLRRRWAYRPAARHGGSAGCGL